MDHLVSLSLCLTVFCVSLAHNYHAFLFLLPVLALALSGYQFIFNYPFLFICSLFWHKFFPPFPCVAPRRRWLRSPSVQFRSVHLFIPLICRLFLFSLLYCGVLFFSVSCVFLSFAISFVLLSLSPFFHLSIPPFFFLFISLSWSNSLMLFACSLLFISHFFPAFPFPSNLFFYWWLYSPFPSFLCTLNKPRHLTLSKPCHFTLSKPCHFTLLLSRWAGQGVAVCSVCYATVDFKVPVGGALAAG